MILSENQKILVRKWSKDLDTSAVIFDNWGNDLEFKDTGQIKDSVGSCWHFLKIVSEIKPSLY